MGLSPVNSVTIYQADGTAVAIDLPWELFSEAAQDELQNLDTDGSGELSYDISSDAWQDSELNSENQSKTTFFRLFWALQGTSPQNNFPLDLGSSAARQLVTSEIQNKVYQEVVLTSLDTDTKPQAFSAAKQTLMTFADAPHLYDLASTLIDDYWIPLQETDLELARDYLEVAEECLLECQRIAARIPWQNSGEGDSNLLKASTESLRNIGIILDTCEAKDFSNAIKDFYLMPASFAPTTLNINSDGSGSVSIRVAVPEGKNPDDLVSYFNGASPITYRAHGDNAGTEHRLVATSCVKEADSTYNRSDNSSLIHEDTLNNKLFGDTKHARQFYHVVFNVENAAASLKGKETGKFDLVIKPQGGRERVVEGGLVLQDKAGKDVRIAFASDVHVTERDYFTVADMVASLNGLNDPKLSPEDQRAYVDRIGRFYQSLNENVEALVEQWNDSYQKGDIDRVVIAGDLADYINIAFNANHKNYRETNFRRLHHILSKVEAPISIKPGNHDFHILPFALSQHTRGLYQDPELESLLAEHSDKEQFGTSGTVRLTIYSLASLLPRYKTNINLDDNPEDGHVVGHFFFNAGLEAVAEDSFTYPFADGMTPYYQRFEHNEADLTRFGGVDGTYLFQWDTKTEHFNADLWRFEEIPNPAFVNFWRGVAVYATKQRVNGKGPRPETILYFMKTANEVREQGGDMVVSEHYPPFTVGSSAADQTPFAADALNGPPNWALRLATYYHRHGNVPGEGDPVIDVVVSGHIHMWGEYDFYFSFADELDSHLGKWDLSAEAGQDLRAAFNAGLDDVEQVITKYGLEEYRSEIIEDCRAANIRKAQFDEELTTLFTSVNNGEYDKKPKHLMHDVKDIWYDWNLGDRTVTRRVLDTSQGYPGGIGQDFNLDSEAYGEDHGTLFINLPASGPSKEPTYVVLTAHADGSKELDAYSYFLRPDGTMLSGSSTELPQMRQELNAENASWKQSHGDEANDVFEGDTGSSKPLVAGPLPSRRFTTDPFPVITQAGELGLEFTVAPSWQLGEQESVLPSDTLIGGQLTFPLSEHHSSLLGFNSIFLSAQYAVNEQDWQIGGGLDLGAVNPIVRTTTEFDELTVGARLFGSSAVFVPALIPTATIKDGGLESVGLSAQWRLTLLGIEP
jgi:hypothetical protein